MWSPFTLRFPPPAAYGYAGSSSARRPRPGPRRAAHRRRTARRRARAPGDRRARQKAVLNGPVFNDPFGSPARQKAVFTQLVDLVNATPAGQTIRGSMLEFAHRGRFFPRGDSSKIRSACGG
ncbi:hypothetical protein [Streptomyces sp. NPDC088752]|uniref:hypothetical protein n=1 Tax=Streptomyces sp. NPDC088752 TaxID=3154963 RepID=UPI003440E13F